MAASREFSIRAEPVGRSADLQTLWVCNLWQTQDKRTLRRVNNLIRDIQRGDATGKPEPLRGDLSGWLSRRIDEKNRIVYRVRGGALEIVQCGSHWRRAANF